jgi:pimeloyl-ACP methyl ester carboxylesterase
MSSTGSRWSGQPRLSVYRYLLGQAPADRDAYVEFATRIFQAVGSPGFPKDLDYIRDRAARSFDRGHNRAGVGRQLGAVLASGDRTAQLRRITAPTLVVHGTRDKLVSPSGGRATARAIPNAELMTIEGMGHDLPPAIWDRLIDGIAVTAERADRAIESAAA